MGQVGLGTDVELRAGRAGRAGRASGCSNNNGGYNNQTDVFAREIYEYMEFG